MLAPLGGIGVVAPVPYTGPNFAGVAHGRGALYGDAPSPSCLRDAPTCTPMQRAARALSFRPAAQPKPFAIEENLPCVRDWDAPTCRIWRRWT
jgi:hypothetical protein